MKAALSFYREALILADGTATIYARPERANERWEVSGYTCFSNSDKMTMLSVYAGSVLKHNLIEHTRRGNGASSNKSLKLPNGEQLVFVWTDGNPGRYVSITIQGTLTRE
jgi:hypothetical protein